MEKPTQLVITSIIIIIGNIIITRTHACLINILKTYIIMFYYK